MKTAIIINCEKIYNSYINFARKHGFPDAADYSAGCSLYGHRFARNGDRVNILTKGNHGFFKDRVLYIIEYKTGNRKYQAIIDERGLKFE